jgi:hypothetical protein
MSGKLLENYSSEQETAKQLKQSVRTLRAWRQQGIGPAWLKIGRTIYYPVDGVAVWLKSIEQKPVRARRAA